MTVLWVTRRHGPVGGGDVIYDTKLALELRRTTSLLELEVPPAENNLLRLTRGLWSRLPHDRASYASADAARRLVAAASDPAIDAVVLSHECLDWAADLIHKPTVLLLHNVSSAYADSLFGAGPFSRVLTRGYQAYERKAYRARPHMAIVCLSKGDERRLGELPAGLPVFRAWPGLPALTPLSAEAEIRPDLTLSGTFGWLAKRRDLERFAAEYERTRPDLRPILAEPIPEALVHKFYDARKLERDPAGAIGFGLVTDRFDAGFKLKVGAHIAANMITLSYSDVLADYVGLPYAEEFILRVRAMEDLRGAMQQVMARPRAETVERFRIFKAAAAERFTWIGTAHAAQQALDAVMAPQAGAAPEGVESLLEDV